MPLSALTPSERHILVSLTGKRGAVVPFVALYPQPTWGDPSPKRRYDTLRVHLSALRRKLTAAGYIRASIETVRGQGVRLAVGRRV
jgi:DNA-binding response OmpR family regulator